MSRSECVVPELVDVVESFPVVTVLPFVSVEVFPESVELFVELFEVPEFIVSVPDVEVLLDEPFLLLDISREIVAFSEFTYSVLSQSSYPSAVTFSEWAP